MFPFIRTVLVFFIAGLLFLRLERVDHWERIASRWRPAFSSHLTNGILRYWVSILPVAENRGDLKGSTQHWLAVYPPEFEIPTFFVAVDSDAARSRPDPSASSRTDPPSSA